MATTTATVTGTGFDPGCHGEIVGVGDLPTSWVSATEAVVTIDLAAIPAAGDYDLLMCNPGGDSGPYTLTFNAAALSGADETFTGAAAALLTTAPSNYVAQVWQPGPPPRNYPVPLLDGSGNITTDMSTTNQAESANFAGYTVAVHNAQLNDDCWAEIVYQRSAATSANASVGVRFPTPQPDTDLMGVRVQQGGAPGAANLRVYKNLNTQITGSPFSVTAANGADHTLRIECQGNVYRVFLDGTKVVDYTDPTPVHVPDGQSRSRIHIDQSTTGGVNGDVVIRSHKAGSL